MSNAQQQLGKAFELIRQDRVDEAAAIIRPITEADPKNTDAWWLLANATGDEREARRALVTLLKMNPSYPKARALLDQLNDQYPPRDDELMMMMDLPDEEPPLPTADPVEEDQGFSFGDPFAEEPETTKATPQAGGSGKNKRATTSDLDTLFAINDAPADDFGLADDDDPFASLLEDDAGEQLKPKKARSGGRRRLMLLLLIPLFLLCAVLAIVLGGGGEDEEATPAALTDPADLVPIGPEVFNPEGAVELEQVRQTLEREAQTSLGPDARALFAQTSAGNALVLRLCGQPNPQLSQLTVDGMNLIALRVGSTPAIQESLVQVGVTVEDCQRNNDTLYRAFSPMADVVKYSQNYSNVGALPLFRQSWVVES